MRAERTGRAESEGCPGAARRDMFAGGVDVSGADVLGTLSLILSEPGATVVEMPSTEACSASSTGGSGAVEVDVEGGAGEALYAWA